MEAAIKGLVAGTLKPEDVKVEGIDTEEEKAEKEVNECNTISLNLYIIFWFAAEVETGTQENS